MALWGKTDDSNSAPKSITGDSLDDVYFVDLEEAADEDTRAKGIKNAGWIRYVTYTDAQSVTRHKVETLVSMRVSAEDAGDRDDFGPEANTAPE